MVLLSGLLTCHSMGPQGHFFENIFWQWGHSSGSCCKNVWVCGLHGTWGRKNMGNTVLGHAVKEMALVLFTKDRDTSTTTLVKWKLLRHGRRDLHTWPSLVSLFALCSLNTHTLTLIYTHFPCLSGMHAQECTLCVVGLTEVYTVDSATRGGAFHLGERSLKRLQHFVSLYF